MKEVLLPALRTHVPDVPTGAGKPTWHLPYHVYTEKGIDIDFGPLLLFERAIFDECTFEYLRTSKKAYLFPLRDSINVLLREGFAELRDFGSTLKQYRPAIDKHVDSMVADPTVLKEAVCRGIASYRSQLPAFRQVFGNDFDPGAMELGFGAHLFLLKHFGKLDLEEAKRLDALLSKKKRLNCEERDDLRELIRPTICYLYQNMALSEASGVPFLDVDYTSELYQLLYQGSLRNFNSQSRETLSQVTTAQRLFKVVIPNLRPTSPMAMLKLLQDDSIKHFRDFISESARLGRLISQEDFLKLTTEVIRKQNELEKLRGVLGWTERIVSLVPGAGPICSVLGIAAEKVAHHEKLGKYDWLYALVTSAPVDEVTRT